MPAIAFSKIRKMESESLVDKIYKELKINILSTVLKGGEKLSINQLSKQMGVSFTPVRDAVNRLAYDGLLTIVPGSGTYVTTLSYQDIQKLYRCRLINELGALEDAMPHITGDTIRHLEETVKVMQNEGRKFLEAMKLRCTEDQPALFTQYFELDRHFHETIVAQSGNTYLQKIFRSINLIMHLGRVVYSDYFEQMESHMQLTDAGHQRILNAIKARDLSAAGEALRRHIEHGQRLMLHEKHV